MVVYSPVAIPRLKAAAVGFGQAAQNIQPQPVGSQRIAAVLFFGGGGRIPAADHQAVLLDRGPQLDGLFRRAVAGRMHREFIKAVIIPSSPSLTAIIANGNIQHKSKIFSNVIISRKTSYLEIPFTAVNGKIDVSVWMAGRLLCRGWISRGVSELGMAAMCGLRVRAAGESC